MAINWFPVNINSAGTLGSPNSNNPMASDCWIRAYDFHNTNSTCYDGNPFSESFITPAAMNFYRGTTMPAYISSVETTHSKMMFYIEIWDYDDPVDQVFEPRHRMATRVCDKALASGNYYNL